MENAKLTVTRFSNEDVIATSTTSDPTPYKLINFYDGTNSNVKFYENGIDQSSKYFTSDYTFKPANNFSSTSGYNVLSSDDYDETVATHTSKTQIYNAFNGFYEYDETTKTFTHINQ